MIEEHDLMEFVMENSPLAISDRMVETWRGLFLIWWTGDWEGSVTGPFYDAEVFPVQKTLFKEIDYASEAVYETRGEIKEGET